MVLAALGSNAQVRRQPTLEERQVGLRSVKRERPKRTEFTEVDWQRIANDFESLQVESTKLRQLMSVAPVPDYPQIRTTAAEVKKRAQRLKSLLSFPEPEKGTQVERSEVSKLHDLRVLTDRLMTRVEAFAANPVFERVRVFNVTEAERASADIDAVVRMSQDIRKGAEVLRKAEQ
ncbi:MAG TPA: hypothetical protein VJV21_04865 [Pyrinomonadaceae bacterium]|nr:hypothetical protein [Pyrinomonadaceae bacterium]